MKESKFPENKQKTREFSVCLCKKIPRERIKLVKAIIQICRKQLP